MILGVNHTITPGDFKTQITGVRQSVYSYANPDTYLQSIITKLIDNVQTLVKQEKTLQTTGSQNTPQDKQNQSGSNQNKSVSNDETCTVNAQFSTFEKVTPKVTSINFSDMIKTITGSTSSVTTLNSKGKDKLNYLIWSIFYSLSSNDVGFNTYNHNYNLLPMNLKINNKEKELPKDLVSVHLKKEYFCLKGNELTSPIASYNGTANCVGYTSNYLKNRVTSFKKEIKDSNNEILDIDNLAKEIYKFIFLNWPSTLNESEYNKIKNNETTKNVENVIKQGITTAQEYGL
jgi:hypothetical protein